MRLIAVAGVLALVALVATAAPASAWASTVGPGYGFSKMTGSTYCNSATRTVTLQVDSQVLGVGQTAYRFRGYSVATNTWTYGEWTYMGGYSTSSRTFPARAGIYYYTVELWPGAGAPVTEWAYMTSYHYGVWFNNPVGVCAIS